MFPYLGEERGPDGLDVLDTSGLDQGLELVGLVTQSVSIPQPRAGPKRGVSYSDINTVIGEDEGGVGDSEFGVRHLEDGFVSGEINVSTSPLVSAVAGKNILRWFLRNRRFNHFNRKIGRRLKRRVREWLSEL